MPTYPTHVGYRIAYDRDGSVGFTYISGSSVTTLTNAQMVTWNNESTDTVSGMASGGTNFSGVIFPQLMDIQGYYINGTSNVGGMTNLSTSADTTNGSDGTWTLRLASPVNDGTSAAGFWRNNAQALSVAGVKGIRYQ